MLGSSQARGLFVTLEGMDGAGKSTHIPDIIALFQQAGYQVLASREPGGTPLGESLRTILLQDSMHAETESLLMFAARREHIAQVIAPGLAQGMVVISDRFTDATYAYQCGAKGVAKSKIRQLEQWVQGDLQPDLTLLFDVPVAVSLARLQSARTPDKFEREDATFFQQLRDSYLSRAVEYPDRFRVINANQTLEMVKNEVKVIIEEFILNN